MNMFTQSSAIILTSSIYHHYAQRSNKNSCPLQPMPCKSQQEYIKKALSYHYCDNKKSNKEKSMNRP